MTRRSGYHLVNILLHGLSALLLVAVLRRLDVPGAWLAGWLFALHPVMVESVAWITELKNALSGALLLATALAYLAFDGARTRRTYALSLVSLPSACSPRVRWPRFPAPCSSFCGGRRGGLSSSATSFRCSHSSRSDSPPGCSRRGSNDGSSALSAKSSLCRPSIASSSPAEPSGSICGSSSSPWISPSSIPVGGSIRALPGNTCSSPASSSRSRSVLRCGAVPARRWRCSRSSRSCCSLLWASSTFTLFVIHSSRITSSTSLPSGRLRRSRPRWITAPAGLAAPFVLPPAGAFTVSCWSPCFCSPKARAACTPMRQRCIGRRFSEIQPVGWPTTTWEYC